jgi:uncharacterized protein
MPSMCRSRAPGRFTPPATARVALFLMDYPQRTRLKILGYARVEDAREHPELVAQIAEPVVHRLVERLFCIEVVSFDWNCSQYITPRYTAGEIQELVSSRNLVAMYVQATVARLPRLRSQTNSVYQP